MHGPAHTTSPSRKCPADNDTQQDCPSAKRRHTRQHITSRDTRGITDSTARKRPLSYRQTHGTHPTPPLPPSPHPTRPHSICRTPRIHTCPYPRPSRYVQDQTNEGDTESNLGPTSNETVDQGEQTILSVFSGSDVNRLRPLTPPPPDLPPDKGGGDLVWENFCPEKFRRGKSPPQSLKLMGKIAPPFSMVKGKA